MTVGKPERVGIVPRHLFTDRFPLVSHREPPGPCPPDRSGDPVGDRVFGSPGGTEGGSALNGHRRKFLSLLCLRSGTTTLVDTVIGAVALAQRTSKRRSKARGERWWWIPQTSTMAWCVMSPSCSPRSVPAFMAGARLRTGRGEPLPQHAGRTPPHRGDADQAHGDEAGGPHEAGFGAHFLGALPSGSRWLRVVSFVMVSDSQRCSSIGSDAGTRPSASRRPLSGRQLSGEPGGAGGGPRSAVRRWLRARPGQRCAPSRPGPEPGRPLTRRRPDPGPIRRPR
jgi:hypothetical protein